MTTEEIAEKMPEDFESLYELMEYFNCEQRAERYIFIKRWQNGLATCPHCGCDDTYYFSDGKRYKCRACLKKYTVRVGTIFQDSKISLRKWIVAMYLNTCHKKGISSYQLARDIKVTQKTAWFMLQRIRFGLGFAMPKSQMEGIIEVDETFVGGKNKNRHGDKKVKNSQGRSFKDKTPVFGALTPNEYELKETKAGNMKKSITKPSQVRCFVIPDTSSNSIQPILRKIAKMGSTIVSDEWIAYSGLDWLFDHKVVDHRAKQYVSEDGYSSNGVENVWSQLKRAIIGIYHGVSRKHLQLYANETMFRHNTRQMKQGARISFAVSLFGHPLKYKDLIRKAA